MNLDLTLWIMENVLRFQSQGFCSVMYFRITQMCGGELDEAETKGREMCEESRGEGSLGQGSGNAEE